MFLLDMMTYIDTNSATYTAGTNLFAAKMPEYDPGVVAHEVCTIYEYQGRFPLETMGVRDSIIVLPHLQVCVRSAPSNPVQTGYSATAYYDASLRITALRTILATLSNATVNSTLYLRAEPLGTPFVQQLDKTDRYHLVCNFAVWQVNA